MVKKTLLSMAIAAAVVSLAGCNVSTTDKYDNKIINEGVQYGPASSVYPIFAPEAGQVPLAIDFLFADAGASDGTANTAVDPLEPNPVLTALNKLDGFSTVAPLYIEFSEALDPETVKAGVSVHLVKLRNGVDDPAIDALDIDTILASNPTNPFSPKPILPTDYEARYITMDDGRTPAIQVLLKKPLEAKTKYLVLFRSAVKGISGQAAGQSTTYSHAIGTDNIVNPDLAPVRDALQGWQQLAQRFLAAGAPLNANAKGKAVFNYTFTTGGTDDVLKAMTAPGTFSTLQQGVATQISSIVVGEGAIKGAILGGGGSQAHVDGMLDMIAASVAEQLNLANTGNTEWNPLPENATVRPILKAQEALQPYYLAGLRQAITKSQSDDLAAVIDAPTSRDYQAIVSPAGAVSVSYDDFFGAQIKPVAEATITENVSNYWKTVTPNISEADLATKVADALANGTILLNAGGPGVDVPVPSLAQAVSAQVTALSSHGAIYQGGLEIPSYLPDAEAGKHDMQLGTWTASDSAAQALGLEENKDKPGEYAPRDINGSTNVTYRFPFAKKQGEKTIPVMATLPANDGQCAKANFPDGYPVAIYQHGITVDRTAGVLVGNELAKACVAMVAIDHVMHGVAPGNATGLVFSTDKISSTAQGVDLAKLMGGTVDEQKAEQAKLATSPFAFFLHNPAVNGVNSALADIAERHNNVGKDAAQANVQMKFASAGDAADVGASGDLYINLNNFARTRDAMRQTVLDLMNLNASIGAMDIDGDGAEDLDPSKVYFIGHSLGAIIGTTFVAVNNDPDVQAFNGNLPKIQGAILGNGGGGVVKLLENSPSIGGAKILPGLQAAAGLEQGSADIEKFFGVMQAMVDSADPINFVSAPHMQTLPILSYEAVGGVDDAKPDLVVPNNALNATVATAKSYLAGTDPLVKLLGITTQYDQSTASALQQNPDGIRANVRVGTGDHSTFSNANPQDTFAEIYGQIGSFILSAGKAVNVDNTDVLEPAE